MEKITVVITTYNLEKYIEKAMRSVLNQKTNFDVKILVADDASTDKTVEIVKALKSRNNDKIEIIENAVNQGSLKNSNRAFSMVKSEYFAFLDGDDFWMEENSLQKQIDFLDTHPSYTMCGGNTILMREGKYAELFIDKEKTDHSYSFNDYLAGKVPFVHTSSIVLRNIIFAKGLPEEYYRVENTFENCALRGEDFRFLLHLEQGKIMIFSDVFSCYRIHDKGIWSGASELKRKLESVISLNFQNKYWGKQTDFFYGRFVRAYRNLMNYLIEEKKLCNRYAITEEETVLLTGLLIDISKQDLKWPENDENTENIFHRISQKLKRMLIYADLALKGKNNLRKSGRK